MNPISNIVIQNKLNLKYILEELEKEANLSVGVDRSYLAL